MKAATKRSVTAILIRIEMVMVLLSLMSLGSFDCFTIGSWSVPRNTGPGGVCSCLPASRPAESALGLPCTQVITRERPAYSIFPKLISKEEYFRPRVILSEPAQARTRRQRMSEATNRNAIFSQAALEHIDALYGFAMMLTRNQTEAEDLVQETYLRAVRAFGQLMPDSNLKSWLFAIMRNAWLNQLRHTRSGPRFVELDAEEEDRSSWLDHMASDPYAIYVRKVEREEVRAAIESLPRLYREIIRPSRHRRVQLPADRRHAGMPGGHRHVPARTGEGEAAAVALGVAQAECREDDSSELRIKYESCKEILAQMAFYLDDELQGSERAAVESHLSACGPCREMLESERRFLEMIRAARPLHAAPPELRSRVRRSAERRARAPLGPARAAPANRAESVSRPLPPPPRRP